MLTPGKTVRNRIKRKEDYDAAVLGNDRALQTILLFNHYRLLDMTVIHALVPIGSYRGHATHCTRMYDGRLLDRRTFDGHKKYNETLTYWRTDCGKQVGNKQSDCCGKHWLQKKGKPVFSDYGPAQDEEQSLIDLVDAGFEIASKESDTEFHKWHDIVEHPATPKLPDHPLRFPDGETFLVPDGLPAYVKRGNSSILLVKEVIRTNKSTYTLTQKIRAYKRLEKAIKARFNFDRMAILFIATDVATEAKVLRLIAEEFGKCQWMLTQTMVDHIAQHLSRAIIPLHLFNEPWNRAYPSRFSLKTLAEV